MRDILRALCALFVVTLIASLLGISSAQMPEREMLFIQISDVHLSDKEFKDSYYGNATDIDPVAFLNRTLKEVADLDPNFVVITGDLVADADGQDVGTAQEAFSLFKITMWSGLTTKLLM